MGEAGLARQHKVVIISFAHTSLELVENGLNASGRVVGAGNIEWLALTPVLEMRRAVRGLHTIEDLARQGIVRVGGKSQVFRLSYAAFYQLAETGGLHGLKILFREPAACALEILLLSHDANKGILDPQAECVQQEPGQGDAAIGKRAAEDHIPHPYLEQLRRNQSFMDRRMGGRGDLRGGCRRPSRSCCRVSMLLPLAVQVFLVSPFMS